MNKSTLAIVISAVLAVVIIAGAGVGVAVLRKGDANEPAKDTTVASVENTENDEYYPVEDYIEYAPEDTSVSVDEQGNTVAIVTDAAGQTSVINNAITKVQNTITTTLKDAASTVKGETTTTKATTTTKKGETTTKETTTTKKNGTTESTGFVGYMIGDDAERSVAGYRYSSDGYYYCDDKDNWQRGTGYNEMYDKWASVAAMYIDQVRLKFKYEDKIWMIQLWKGQYGYLLYGAEIGVYTCDVDEYTGNTGDLNHFKVADPTDWLYMQLDCYYCKGGNGEYKKAFTRPWGQYWWCTGFVKGQLTKLTYPRSEVKTKNTIQFKSEEQANLYVQALKQAGFRRAAGSDSLVDDSYYMSGRKVWVLWSTIYHDAFVGY